MKRLFSLVGLLCTLMLQAQQMPQVPNDPEVRQGKLENGLTYYIRQNGFPEKRATFMIAQHVGSIQEKDSQRGLAHFLEHMCFNGTDHFEGNNVIEYLRTLGIEFGVNLNAETGIETTHYYIDRVPTDRVSSLDSCLLVLKDWANGLTLDGKEIDKERGVIHEEWRMRSNAVMRVFESKLPELYPNNKYGVRFPIGTMEVIDNFKYDELKNYYKEWYHPENQCIIVVGDIDVDRTEDKIKEMFGGIKKPETASSVVPIMVEDNPQPIVALGRDKEPFYIQQTGLQAQNLAMIMTKHAAFDKAQKNSLAYLINRYLFAAVSSMLNERFEDLSQKDDCNFLSANANDGDYMMSSTVSAFEIDVVPKDAAHSAAAIKEVLTEVRRAAEQGFSEDEYNRFKENYMASLEMQVSNIASRDNFAFVNDYKQNFFNAEPYPTISQEYGLMKRIVSQLPFNGVNQIMEQVYSKDDSNVAVLNFNMEQDGVTYPTKDEILKAIKDAHNAELAVFEGTKVDGELIKVLPKAGTIKSESKKQNGDIEFKEIVLSNGVKVYLKQTDFKKDEVVMMALGKGGSSVYGAKDFANISVFNDVIEESGLGGLSNSELKKALSGKKAQVGLSLSPSGLGMQMMGACRPKDMETMMQLTHLMFTNITRDDKSFNKWLKNQKSELESRGSQPMLVFQDSLKSTMYGGNPRVAPITVERLNEISYDRILQIAKERMGSANGWEFFFVGNFDEEALKAQLCQYLGSLLANKENESEAAAKLFDGQTQKFFNVEMETPASIAALIHLNKEMDFTTENNIKGAIMGQILTAKFLEKIREEEGIAYSAEAQCVGDIDIDGSHYFVLQAFCPTAPDKSALALGMMQNEITNMQNTPVEASTLDKVKKQMIKKNEEMLKNNLYWASVLQTYCKFGTDLCTDFASKVEAVTVEDIQKFATEFLKPNNNATILMSPK